MFPGNLSLPQTRGESAGLCLLCGLCAQLPAWSVCPDLLGGELPLPHYLVCVSGGALHTAHRSNPWLQLQILKAKLVHQVSTTAHTGCARKWHSFSASLALGTIWSGATRASWPAGWRVYLRMVQRRRQSQEMQQEVRPGGHDLTPGSSYT